MSKKVILTTENPEEMCVTICDLFLDVVKKINSGLLTQREYNALIANELGISQSHANNIYYKKYDKISHDLMLKILIYLGYKLTFVISK